MAKSANAKARWHKEAQSAPVVTSSTMRARRSAADTMSAAGGANNALGNEAPSGGRTTRKRRREHDTPPAAAAGAQPLAVARPPSPRRARVVVETAREGMPCDRQSRYITIVFRSVCSLLRCAQGLALRPHAEIHSWTA